MAASRPILATSFTQRDKMLLDEALSGTSGGGMPHDPNAIHIGTAAGGDLTGTYPNPLVRNGLFVRIGDSAGGDLAGTYPNPTLRVQPKWSPYILGTPNGTICTIAIDDSDYSLNGTLFVYPQAVIGATDALIVATPNGTHVKLTIDDTNYGATGELILVPVAV